MSAPDVLAILAASPAFASYPPRALAAIAECSEPRTYRADSPIVRQGARNPRPHLVVSGLVRVQRRHPDLTEPVILAELGPGDLVGSLDGPGGQIAADEVVAIFDTLTIEIGCARLEEAVEAI